MKKILALLLAIIMVIGLAACDSQPVTPTENQGTVTPTEGGDSAYVPGTLPLTTTNEKLVIGICQNSKVLSYDDNTLTKLLEEKTGVDIEFMFFASGQADARKQLGLMVAGKEKLPDIIVGILDDAMRSELGNDGILIDCTPYLTNPDFFYYGGKYLALANELETNLFWNQYKDPTSGAIYGYPSIANGGLVDVCGFLGGINNTFAKNVGMDPADIDTVDEVYQYLTKVVNEDANKNGEKDELGILYFPNGYRSNIEQWIVNAYIYWNEAAFFNITDGEVWEPYSTPEFREAFKVLHKWYKEGLISDLSFDISQEGEMKAILEKPENYTIGIFGGHPTKVCNASSQIGEEYTYLNVLADETGKGGATVLRANTIVSMVVAITKDCKNPDLAFRFLDHNVNPELGPVFRYGEEGVNWVKIQGQVEQNGKMIDVFDETGFPAGYNVLKDEWSTETKCTWHYSMNTMWVSAAYEKGLTCNPGYGGYAYYFRPGSSYELMWNAIMEVKSGTEPAEKFFNIPYNAEELEVVTEVQKGLISALNTWRAEFITGVKDPNNDADWQAFLDDMEDKGMYDWLDAAQEAYTRFIEGE